jgi:hypothetical protein
MARSQKDLLSRLADAGEQALQRVGETPGADRFLGVANSMRDRLDEMQRRMRGIDDLEKRVRQLERRVDALSSGATTTSGRARSAAKTSSARKRASSAGSRTTPKKPS